MLSCKVFKIKTDMSKTKTNAKPRNTFTALVFNSLATNVLFLLRESPVVGRATEDRTL